MPKGSEELVQARRDEIIAACEQLYETMSFKDISIKEIGKVTSFSRTSIYNYFQTKEEIFLAILEKEYRLWVGEIEKLISGNESLSETEFAHLLASSLSDHPRFLKLMAMNHYDLEENCSLEMLTQFKKIYGCSLSMMKRAIVKFFPSQDAEAFVYSFFPFLFGIYPYTNVTEKQRIAMSDAGVDYVYMSIEELVELEVKKLLGL